MQDVLIENSVHADYFGAQFQEVPVGQATVVDLGSGRIVVAALNGFGARKDIWRRSAVGALSAVFGLPAIRTSYRDEAHAVASEQGSVDLTPDQFPGLLTFENENDPATYKIVDAENPRAALGEDIRSISMKVEMTNYPVTTGITKTLPWLKSIDNYLSGKTSCSEPTYCVQKWDLIRHVDGETF